MTAIQQMSLSEVFNSKLRNTTHDSRLKTSTSHDKHCHIHLFGMSSFENVQCVDIPSSLCKELLKIVRRNSDKFIRINEEEEPPLRTLNHGLDGEFRQLSACDEDPYPFVIRKDDGKCFHGFRFDQDVCDQAAHTSEYLNARCGTTDPNTGSSFRQVLTYHGGRTKQNFGEDEADVIEKLKDILLPYALKVFGEHENDKSREASAMFSIYTNLLVPGNTIKLHLDVPQFVGLDRSTCPSWLLVAAKCSGLFTEYEVKNVTCVCYPQNAAGGHLLVFDGEQSGRVFPVKEGTAAILDADSLFHVVAQVKSPGAKKDEILAGPDFPTHCRLKVAHISDEYVWTVEDTSGKSVAMYKEADIRFSISCKFHIFHNNKEATEFNEGKRSLTAQDIIRALTADLIKKGILKAQQPIDLFDLAPILVEHYILPKSPTSKTIESVWFNYEK